MRFTDLEELKGFLRSETQSPAISPVRFINVDSMETWVQVKAYLSTLAQRSLLLSNFCEDKDTAPNLNRLKHSIRTSCYPSLVVPLSEYLRINNLIAKKTINDILNANFENNINGRLRIYIPLYRMKEILKDTDLDPRQKNCILYLDTNSDSDYSLTIVQGDLELSIKGNQTRGYQEYLMYWEQNPDKPVILHTKNAIQYKDIVFADDVTVIVSSYDLLRYHYLMPAEIKQEMGTEAQWKELSLGYTQTKSLEGAISLLMPAYQYSENLFQNWSEYTSFKRWLLWLWAKCKQSTDYLGRVAAISTNVNQFTDLVQTEIINLLGSKNFDQYAKQRKKLIGDMKLMPSKGYLESVAKLEPENQIMCLTDLTQQEKRLILLAFAKSQSSITAKNALKTVYPDAYYYFGEIGFNNNQLEDYFSTYRELKLTNNTSNLFLDEVESIARENISLLWGLDARNALVNNLYDNETIVLFIDALGVEYLPLLLHMFGNSSVYEIESHITRCNLPSTTQFNTDFLSDRKHEKFYKLDELKHSAISYPDNIISEFDLLHEIKAKVDELLQISHSVVIAADHGTSRMAVLYRDQASVHQCNENAQLEKYGRYCVDTSNDYSNIDGCFPYNEYWIFANYSRFAERGAPRCETHGGASLEEMIIPVLRINKAGSVSGQAGVVKITVLTPMINVGKAKLAKVIFKLSREYSSVVAIIANQRILCDFVNGEYWFEFAVGSSGQVLVKLLSKGLVLGEFQIKVIKGISMSDFNL